jgi:alkaline phosphatase
VQAAGDNGLSSLRGVLKSASANGYKTGLVTSGNVAKVAPLYFDLDGGGADAARALVSDTKIDFLAGGGRSYFVSNKVPGSKRSDDFDASKAVREAGGSVYFNVESLDEEAKGRVLALQSDDELSYAIDRDEETQAGFDELVSLAVETRGGESNAPICPRGA